MVAQFGLLMTFQFVGELLMTASGIPFPGALCGMLLLLAYLHLRGGASEDLTRVATTLVDNLGLLFVPAGVAIVGYGSLFAQDGLAIAAALIISTFVAVAIGGVVATRRARPFVRRKSAT
jgi:holin-like protein